MKQLADFLRTSVVGGFFVVLPIVLLWLLVGQLYDLTLLMAQPIVDLLPAEAVGGANLESLLAIAILVAVCFLTGVLMRTRSGLRVGSWIERTVLERVPGYGFMREISRLFSGDRATERFQPALVELSPTRRIVGFIAQRHRNGQCTVLLPIAPSPNLGTLQVVAAEAVHPLEATAAEVAGYYFNWGVGSVDLLPPEERAGGKVKDGS